MYFYKRLRDLTLDLSLAKWTTLGPESRSVPHSPVEQQDLENSWLGSAEKLISLP